MDASELKTFEAVARLGSMGRAAEELHTVQSNVTARVRQLESELGTVLFARHARGVEPTRAGRRLLPLHNGSRIFSPRRGAPRWTMARRAGRWLSDRSRRRRRCV